MNFFHGLFTSAARRNIPKLTNVSSTMLIDTWQGFNAYHNIASDSQIPLQASEDGLLSKELWWISIFQILKHSFVNLDHGCPELQYNDSIYVFYDPPVPAKGVIIFFHDIHWKEYEEPHVQSWMSRSEPSICWPQAWLGVKYPEIQILSARYDAGIWKSDTAGHMDLDQLAENLRHDILQIYLESCPVVLVGHGAGGLVIKKLIFNMQGELSKLSRRAGASKESKICASQHRLDCFLKNVKGVFYYATPFLGSQLITSIVALPNRGKLLTVLEVLSTDACRLNDWFRNWRQDRTERCKAIAIFATLPTKVVSWYGNWSTHVVQEASARFDVDDFYNSTSDHFNVCKPPSQTDSSFQMLTDFIEYQMVTKTSWPTSQIGENSDRECEDLLKDLLKNLAELQIGEAFLLKRADLKKFMNYPKLLGNLRDSLKDAGLELSFVNDNFEFWEQVDDDNDSEDAQENSPKQD